MSPNQSNLFPVLTALLLLFPFITFAEDERVAVSLGNMNFDYEETDTDGTFLDGEYGNIRGFTLEYNRKLKNKMFARFSLDYYQGVVDYDGHLQSLTDDNINMFPFQTETEEKVFTLTAYLSSQLHHSISDLFVYGSFSYKNWERDIQGRYVSENGNLGIPINTLIPDLYEVYSWWQVSAGLQYQTMITTQSRIEMYAGMLHTLNPTMEIGPYELNLEEKPGYEAGIAVFFAIASNQRLGIGGSITYWEFGRSNPIPVSADEVILEPDSESMMKTIKLTYERDLKKR